MKKQLNPPRKPQILRPNQAVAEISSSWSAHISASRKTEFQLGRQTYCNSDFFAKSANGR